VVFFIFIITITITITVTIININININNTKACHLLQAPPSLDENNFPSLATSPGPSPRAAANGPASADTPAPEASAVADSDDTESPKAAEKPRAVQKVPSVWGSVEGSAHKATSPEKKSSGTGWVSKGDSMSSQQKAQAANSKLQPSAASFKSRNKSTSRVPWVETGLSFCFWHCLCTDRFLA